MKRFIAASPDFSFVWIVLPVEFAEARKAASRLACKSAFGNLTDCATGPDADIQKIAIPA
jgi:hypothetical protein